MVSRWSWFRFWKLILTSFILASFVAAAFLVLPWIRVFITPRLWRNSALAVLVAMEIAYVAACLVLSSGAAICGVLIWRAHRGTTTSRRSVRGLMLCGSSLLAIGLGELFVGQGRLGRELALLPTRADDTLTEGYGERGRSEAPSKSGGRQPDASPELGLDDDASRSVARVSRMSRGRTLTIGVLGESSAAGVPFERWVSVGKIVAWQIEVANPGQQCSVEIIAEPGDTLEGQVRKLGELKRPIDALIVYCGHNEFASTIPWSRRLPYYVGEEPTALQRLDDLLARYSPICRLIRETADRFRAGMAPANRLRPPLVDVPAYTRSDHTERLAQFRRRLDAIAGFCERRGMIAILVIPPANDAEFEPNRSFLPPETTREARDAFAREFLVARGLEASEPARAVERYRALLRLQPGFAETHFRLGRLLANAGAWDDAYDEFVQARDCDGMPIRCLSSFQKVYREVAARHGCPIVDGQALFHAIGAHGLLDDQLFMDAMHPSLAGQVAVAQAILDALRERGALGVPRNAPASKIDLAECAGHFGLGAREWRIVAERAAMFAWGTALLRYDRGEREAKVAALRDAIKRLADGAAPEEVGMPNLGVKARERRDGAEM